MLERSLHPASFLQTQGMRETSLIDLGADRAIEVLSDVLNETFPVTQRAPDPSMQRLLQQLSSAERR